MLFSWATPLVRFAKNNILHLDYLGDLGEEHTVQYSIVRLKDSWSYYKVYAETSKYALLKATFNAFKFEYITITCINLVNTALNLMSPYLVSKIIHFIETKDNKEDDPDFSTGFFYIALLVIT